MEGSADNWYHTVAGLVAASNDLYEIVECCLV